MPGPIFRMTQNYNPVRQLYPWEFMHQVDIQLNTKKAVGFVIPLGPLNLVAVRTDVGMVGCGVFDVAAFDSFSYPGSESPAGHSGRPSWIRTIS